MLAALPEMNDKVSVSINMGPVVYSQFLRAPLLAFAATHDWALVRHSWRGSRCWCLLQSPCVCLRQQQLGDGDGVPQ
jgi:hypothetical protein